MLTAWRIDMTKTPPPRSPLLAAVLNLIPLPFALGYAYLGRGQRFWVAFAMRVIAIFLGGPILLTKAIECGGGYCSALQVVGVPLLIVGVVLIFSAIDAYGLQRRHD